MAATLMATSAASSTPTRTGREGNEDPLSTDGRIAPMLPRGRLLTDDGILVMSAFPSGFVWGVSTSAFQIEGASTAGGRGASIWGRFAATKGSIVDGSDASVATDHVRRLEEDLDLLSELGIGAYRFSVSWPRLAPSGRGRLLSEGLAFYDRLIDGLLDREIAPWLCLYHWDLPQALQDVGGLGNRDTAEYFADHAGPVAERYADRLRSAERRVA